VSGLKLINGFYLFFDHNLRTRGATKESETL